MTAAAGQDAGRRTWPIYASYAVACGMMICFAAVFIQFLLWLFPALDTRGMLLACTLAALEAFYSFWLVKRLPTAQIQIGWYRATEIAILLVALKLFTELRAGPASFWNNFLLWPVQFPFNILISNFFSQPCPSWLPGGLATCSPPISPCWGRMTHLLWMIASKPYRSVPRFCGAF